MEAGSSFGIRSVTLPRSHGSLQGPRPWIAILTGPAVFLMEE